jgi:beta-aspartyl-peptidase (threonine type)
MKRMKPVIIAHGGAGGVNHPYRRAQGLIKACSIGYGMLMQGRSSLDAVEQAVMELEDISIFNAGRGSSLNLEGIPEMDASIMTNDMKFGAVAALTDVRYPIQVARMVLERTDHLVLGGRNAVRFARIMGMPKYDCTTPEKKRIWKKMRKKFHSVYFEKLPGLMDHYGTVGVVAIDKNGTITAGTSSGGITMRLPGRIGDTPSPGAGTYADKHGGVGATGHGEEILRHLLSFRAVQYMARDPAPIAGKKTIIYASKHKCRCGLIGIDRKGRIMCVNNTKAMSWCYIKNGRMRMFKW